MNHEQQKSTIMIVDDIPENLNLLREMLQIQGYRILAFSHGVPALNSASKNLPNLILLDVKMPDMDGFEVCKHLKADPKLRDIPVIFISALSETIDKVKAFTVGGVDYITKPFQLEEVQARVATHLKISLLQHQINAHNENLERLVEDRTRELNNAYKRLQEVDQLKDDFLTMISHEIRTPANGVLGIGQLLISQCQNTTYQKIFQEASARMFELIENAHLIGNLKYDFVKSKTAISFSDLLNGIKKLFPEIYIAIEPKEQKVNLKNIFIQGDHILLEKALQTIIRLANAFSRNKYIVTITVVTEARGLRLHIDVDDLLLSSEQSLDFFKITSTVRSISSAESLGLAPLAAYKILSVMGGEIKLIKGAGETGAVEALLPGFPVSVQTP